MGDQPWIPVGRRVNVLYPPVNLSEYDLISGIIKVNDLFQPFGILTLFINRFVLYGCLRQVLAQ
jgi:hypothetical protein